MSIRMFMIMMKMISFLALQKIWDQVIEFKLTKFILNLFLFISEAKIRFLKARLRVMQEELDRVQKECIKRVSIQCYRFKERMPRIKRRPIVSSALPSKTNIELSK